VRLTHSTPLAAALLASLALTSCKSDHSSLQTTASAVAPSSTIHPDQFQSPGTPLPRAGDEIVVAGQYFHTGAPVVLWTDPGGYDAYRTERRFAPYEKSSYEATRREIEEAKRKKEKIDFDIESPNRYNLRYTPPTSQPATRMSATQAAAATTMPYKTTQPASQVTPRARLLTGPNFILSPEKLEQVRGGGWELDDLRNRVDQFVYHYDVAGTSRTCFKVLHDMRGLSVHFMLDVDGTIYQTLDLKERAWHATTSNTRSIGIEIANMGAYPNRGANPLAEWYSKDPATGHTYLHIPSRFGDGGIRDKSVVLKPIRDDIVTGQVQGKTYHQYDLTPQQYDSLIKLTATLCTVFPKINCDYPKDKDGHLIPQKLDDQDLATYHGLLGHYHVQLDKQDPGPAFQWDKVVDGARALMKK
jgi:N-acetyl-anhydromuramyl-L-alanine amidase AmpD